MAFTIRLTPDNAGDVVKVVRRGRGLRQKDVPILAVETMPALQQSDISQWETRKRQMYLRTFVLLMESLGGTVIVHWEDKKR